MKVRRDMLREALLAGRLRRRAAPHLPGRPLGLILLSIILLEQRLELRLIGIQIKGSLE